jgi:MFS family permease
VEPGVGEGVWSLLRRARLLQVIVVVVIAANLANGGTFEVALPALAHARFGPGGYGALIAGMGAGAVLGTLAAALAGRAGRPALVACGCYLVEALAIALVPFLGGLPGALAATFVNGAGNGLGNVVFITLIQRWAPPALLGRVMSLVMLAALGSFPVSVAVTGVLVHHLGAAPFFPVAGVLVAVAVLGAMSQREFRDFGAAQPPRGRGHPRTRRSLSQTPRPARARFG